MTSPLQVYPSDKQQEIKDYFTTEVNYEYKEEKPTD